MMIGEQVTSWLMGYNTAQVKKPHSVGEMYEILFCMFPVCDLSCPHLPKDSNGLPSPPFHLFLVGIQLLVGTRSSFKYVAQKSKGSLAIKNSNTF